MPRPRRRVWKIERSLWVPGHRPLIVDIAPNLDRRRILALVALLPESGDDAATASSAPKRQSVLGVLKAELGRKLRA
jgi:hypothetical protein